MRKAGRPPEPWKRDLIIDAAATVLTERGVNSTSLQDLADAAGVSRAAIHYHFSGMDGVVLSVAERGYHLMYTRRAEAMAKQRDVRVQLVGLIRMGIPSDPPNEYIVMYESIATFRANSDFRPFLDQLSQAQVALYLDVLQRGVEQGAFRPRESLDDIAWNLIALEDAAGIYITIGTAPPVEIARGRMISYATSSLDCDLRDENSRQRDLGIG